MKYPQLVSTRAVSAISDWLVLRLEELGVEAPLVYSRLLLSLLHTPFQVNALDLADIPHLKGFIEARGGRRLTASDTETLKRFAAVESIMDATSSDQQKSEIEDLVNELYDKLREIENESVSTNFSSTEISTKSNTTPVTQNSSNEDPTKRYYSAFPALNNEATELSFAAMPSNSNSLCWSNIMSTKLNGNNNAGNNNNSSGNNANLNSIKKKPNKKRRNTGTSKIKSCYNRKSLDSESALWDMNFQGNWEMGQDLIGEFVNKQNKRNRSISESDANNFQQASGYFINTSSKTSFSNTETAKLTEMDRKQQILIGNKETYINDMEQSSLLPTQLLDETIVNIDNNNNAENNERPTETADYMNVFKAKFDDNVKALWEDNINNIDNMNDFNLNIHNSKQNNAEKVIEQNFYCEPVNSDSLMSASNAFNNIYNFIQSGTNLTNSIWSENNVLSLPQEMESQQQQHHHIHESESLTKFWHEESKPNSSGDAHSKINLNSNLINYSLQDIIKSSKWSDCSYDNIYIHPNSFNENETNKNAISPKNNINNSNTYRNINKNYNLSDTSYTTAPTSNVSTANLSGVGLTARPLNMLNERKITLANHSKNSSFVAVTPSTSSSSSSSNSISSSSSMIYDSINLQADKNAIQLNEGENETSENLLTSERTHFRPIKHTYVDGHTFKINITPNNIEYNRSESGFSCFESEKYLEFKPIKNFEEPSHHQSMSDDEDEYKIESIKVMFCYKMNDKGCQTDQLNMDSFYIKMQNNLNDTMENFRDIEMDMNWRNDGITSMTTGTDTMMMIRNNDQYTAIQPQSLNYFYTDHNVNRNALCPKMTMDSSAEYSSIENWNLSEKNKICPDNNNSHSLWEHCSTCGNTNNAFTSLPANRMLKDELSADGDEIMSDLNTKYMQNLCIGDDTDDNVDDVNNSMCSNLWENSLTLNFIDGIKVKSDMQEYNRYLPNLLKPEPTQMLTEILSNSLIESSKYISDDFNDIDIQDNPKYDNTFNLKHETDIWKIDENHNDSEFGYEILQNVKNSVMLNTNNSNNNNRTIIQSDYDDVNYEKFQDICLLNLNNENMKNNNMHMPQQPQQQQIHLMRSDRKRRHSACQNIFDSTTLTSTGTGKGTATKTNNMDANKNITTVTNVINNKNNNDNKNYNVIMKGPTNATNHNNKNNLSVFLKFEKLISFEYVDAMYLNRYEAAMPLNIDELTHAEISRPLTR